MIAAAFALGAGTIALASGWPMLRRPESYLGSGRPPATDPSTVRKFGIFSVTLGGILVTGGLIRFVQG